MVAEQIAEETGGRTDALGGSGGTYSADRGMKTVRGEFSFGNDFLYADAFLAGDQSVL